MDKVNRERERLFFECFWDGGVGWGTSYGCRAGRTLNLVYNSAFLARRNVPCVPLFLPGFEGPGCPIELPSSHPMPMLPPPPPPLMPHVDTRSLFSVERLEVTYSYWDGSGHRREIVLNKGITVGAWLCALVRGVYLMPTSCFVDRPHSSQYFSPRNT